MSSLALQFGAKVGNSIASLIACYRIEGAKPKNRLEKIQSCIFRALCYGIIPHIASQAYSKHLLANFSWTRALFSLTCGVSGIIYAEFITDKEPDPDPIPGLNIPTLTRTIGSFGFHLLFMVAFMGLSKIGENQLSSFFQSRTFSVLNQIPFLSII